MNDLDLVLGAAEEWADEYQHSTSERDRAGEVQAAIARLRGGPAEPDPWQGQNPLGCCRHNVTEGGRPTHGGPDCRWPGRASAHVRE